VLCIGRLIHSGLLLMLEIITGSPVSAEVFLLLLRRRWRNQGLAAGRRAATTHLLAARLRGRCRRSVWVKRLGVSTWLVRRICWRGHGECGRTVDFWIRNGSRRGKSRTECCQFLNKGASSTPRCSRESFWICVRIRVEPWPRVLIAASEQTGR
jgi:hypothetical protein